MVPLTLKKTGTGHESLNRSTIGRVETWLIHCTSENGTGLLIPENAMGAGDVERGPLETQFLDSAPISPAQKLLCAPRTARQLTDRTE